MSKNSNAPVNKPVSTTEAKSKPTLDILRDVLEKSRDLRITDPAHGKIVVGTVAARLAKAIGGKRPDPTLSRDVVTGLGVQEFQNALFVRNEGEGWKFNDHVLAVAWAVCLPLNNARVGKGEGFTADPTKYVGGTRTLFNAGKHGALPGDLKFRKSEARHPARAPKPEVKKEEAVTAPAGTPATVTAAA